MLSHTLLLKMHAITLYQVRYQSNRTHRLQLTSLCDLSNAGVIWQGRSSLYIGHSECGNSATCYKLTFP